MIRPDEERKVTMLNQRFYQDLDGFTRVYEGCQNILGVVPLTEAGYPAGLNFMEDATLRRKLQDWGRVIGSDSVMVLEGTQAAVEQQGYHYKMYVFEPNGTDPKGLAGGISTMCGNGVRAVAAYVRQAQPNVQTVRVLTLSGLRKIEVDGDQYLVDMGSFYFGRDDLKDYISEQVPTDSSGNYLDVPIPKEILMGIDDRVVAKTWSIGLTGDKENGVIDGEPHVILEVTPKEAPDIEGLRRLAVELGPVVTKNLGLFPKEINLNLIVLGDRIGSSLDILNSTHERNLGDDADHSVTAACGTGSTVAGGFLFRQDSSLQRVVVHNWGGDLTISRDKKDLGRLLMRGPANEVKL